MSQSLGQVAFSEIQTTPVSKTLLLEALMAQTAPGTFVLTFNAAASDGDRNVHSITIADPVAASVPDEAIYKVNLSDGTTSRTYLFQFKTGMTAAQVASQFAAILDLHPGLGATATGSTISITALVSGVALTVTVDCTDETNVQVAGAISTAEVTPSSGTVTPLRKYADITVTVGASTDRKPTLQVSGKWYNGSPVTPVQAQAMGPWPSTSPKTISEMQAVA